LIERMMNYAGFDFSYFLSPKHLIKVAMNFAGFMSEDILNNIKDKNFSNFTMVVVDKKKATDAWNFDLGPFQPTWKQLYRYLGDPAGFQVCGDNGCTKKRMPKEFSTTLTSNTSQQTNGIKDYVALTGCPKGFRETRNPSRIRATCSLEYKEMKEKFKASFCPNNNPCGTTACVDIYTAGPAGTWPADDLYKLTLWTRAFFEICMGMNEWFTGLGLGYDPTHNVTTGKEWLVRGDKGVLSTSLDAAYVNLWSRV